MSRLYLPLTRFEAGAARHDCMSQITNCSPSLVSILRLAYTILLICTNDGTCPIIEFDYNSISTRLYNLSSYPEDVVQRGGSQQPLSPAPASPSCPSPSNESPARTKTISPIANRLTPNRHLRRHNSRDHKANDLENEGPPA